MTHHIKNIILAYINVNRIQHAAFKTIFISKDDLSNIVNSKDTNIIYNTTGFFYFDPHRTIPITLHFERVNKFSIIVSKMTATLTEDDCTCLYKFYNKRKNLLTFFSNK